MLDVVRRRGRARVAAVLAAPIVEVQLQHGPQAPQEHDPTVISAALLHKRGASHGRGRLDAGAVHAFPERLS